MLEVCASKIGDIILSVLESKMENKLDEVKKQKLYPIQEKASVNLKKSIYKIMMEPY